MSESENNKKDVRKNAASGDADFEQSPLVDVFSDGDLSDTRRVSIDEMDELKQGRRGRKNTLEERDYRPVRGRRDGRLGCMGGVMYAVFVISVSIILACFCWMAASDVLALNKDSVTATITLPKDIFTDVQQDVKDDSGNVTGTETVKSADMGYVASQLKDNGLIQYKWLFELYARVSHASVKIDPGTYELTTKLDYRALVKNMQVGTESMVVTKLTFPEGYTMAQIFQKLEDNDVCSVADLEDAAANYNYQYAFLENVGTGDKLRLEGFLFPDTYDFYQGEQASSVINKMLSTLHYKITADMWTECDKLGITFRQADIVASMIEKEAGSDEERANIASVIYNRMKAGMPLGIDSTILYEFPDFSGSTIPDNIINYDSPYNTRLYTGLPPTPICNPGMASLKAALWPNETKYLYYALNTATGTHEFFTNQADFSAFVATQNYG